MESTNPIGIFDSGLGGLTVVKAVNKLLPNEDIIYLGDTARVPYGNKSQETVQRYSLEIGRFLVQKKVKMIIVACNSASSLGIEAIRREISLPVLGVIGPGARTAVRNSSNMKIGVIGTRGTINSGAYQSALQATSSDVETFAEATPLFVPLVEEGWADSEITRQVADVYLEPLKNNGIDTLILGCTHYPFLKSLISSVMGAGVKLVDSAEALAAEASQTLIDHNMTNENPTSGLLEYYTTDDPKSFIEIGQKLINLDLSNTKQNHF